MTLRSFVYRTTRVNIVCGVERKSNESKGISVIHSRLYGELEGKRERGKRGGYIVKEIDGGIRIRAAE